MSGEEGGGGCSPRHGCCGSELGGRGCKKVCRKCGLDWGTPSSHCFVRDHNLVSIQSLHNPTDHVIEEGGKDEKTQLIQTSKFKAKLRNKKLQKVTEILEKYPQIITYHII